MSRVTERLWSMRGLTSLGSVLLLSLATVGSAWCSYQAARWSGIQLFQLNGADKADRSGERYEVQSTQGRVVDAAMFVQWMSARERGEKRLATYLRDRFRPEAAKAMDAWLATDPDTNTNAPKTPFVMPEYRLPGAERAGQLRQEAGDLRDAARASNGHSDNYVLVTVIFAMVLFFTGICTKLPRRAMRRATLGIGVVMFVVGVGAVCWLPVAGATP